MKHWLQQHMLPCAFKTFFGIDCPLCGAQRAFILLLNGRPAESFTMFSPLVFVLGLLLFSLVYLLFPKLINAKYLRVYAAIVLCIVMLNYGVKIFTGNITG